MGLQEYRRKRKFGVTAEPRGRKEKSTTGRSFVVQHHLASHEHHDFRLELDGVLKSWAVPKLVSKTAGVRRLAVEVEDHPLAYGSFEGRIPEGEYGAGTVSIYDSGTWEPEGDPHQGLRDGKLSFALHGKKLKGNWVLVRTSEAENRTKPQWLLIKRKRT